jgi:hypothetical protein
MIFGRELRDVEGSSGVGAVEWSGDFSAFRLWFLHSVVPSQPPHAVPPPTNETYDIERGAHVFSLASLLLIIYILAFSLSTCTARGIAWHSMELLLLPWGRAISLPPRLKSYVPVHTPVGTFYVSKYVVTIRSNSTIVPCSLEFRGLLPFLSSPLTRRPQEKPTNPFRIATSRRHRHQGIPIM